MGNTLCLKEAGGGAHAMEGGFCYGRKYAVRDAVQQEARAVSLVPVSELARPAIEHMASQFVVLFAGARSAGVELLPAPAAEPDPVYIGLRRAVQPSGLTAPVVRAAAEARQARSAIVGGSLRVQCDDLVSIDLDEYGNVEKAVR